MSSEIRVRNTINKIKYEECTKTVNLNLPLQDQLPQLLTELGLNSEKIKISNLQFLINKQQEKAVITDLTKTLADYNFDSHNNHSLQIEEKFFELSSELSITIAYIGPIIIFSLFYFLHFKILVMKQHLIYALGVLHYSKRIYETNYIHIYGKQGFPLFSKEYIGLVFYYWFLFGYLIGSFALNNEYSVGNYQLNVTHYLAIILHLFCEWNNYKSHVILKRLKLENSRNRGIPRGNMFNYVSNAHYFWELLSWLSFYLLVRNLTSGLFVIFSFISMCSLALEKHKNMKKYFGDKFPAYLKAFIPYIL